MGQGQELGKIAAKLMGANDYGDLEILPTFNTVVAHELRTPLTVINGVLNLLQTGKLDIQSDGGQSLVELALQSTNRLVRLAQTVENQSISLMAIRSAADLERLQLANDLCHALDRQEILLFYQPIVSLKTNRIEGFEALARWNHPIQGFISPNIFIPLAEDTGLIHQLGDWILQQACKQLKAWQQQFALEGSLTMSVNLSGHQLTRSDLPGKITKILQKTEVNPESLRLEITESSLPGNPDRAITTLCQLKALGVHLDLDDFGTGYSSFARLQSLPIERLKLDRVFVHHKQWVLLEGILRLASTLLLDVVVEGVEIPEELFAVSQAGCHKVQGYLFSRPLNSQDAKLLLAGWG